MCIRDSFYNQQYRSIKAKSKMTMCNRFAEFIDDYSRCSKRYYNPTTLKSFFKEDFDGDTEQHDAHEYFITLREKLRDEINPLFPKTRPKITDASSYWAFHTSVNNSIIDKLFSGLQVATVTCETCNNEEFVYEPFLELFLPLEGSSNIQECMTRYLTAEKIGSYSCDKCKNKNTRAVKQTHISILPQILVISLKRFKIGTYKRKITDMIDYPLDLDLTKFAPKQSCQYTLIGVIMHHGSLDSGHYVSFSKVGEKWYLFDDEDVRPAQPRDVLKREAYILMYRQID
eukprot:TRINITY_DN12027_c0_g1_i1.p1 TRINITY_DN12027_c0_g1~~TRINITY_DN12027_c0_g1_i1.p1  ORF type:complete len:286 (+),score=35.48 TRINITY_DN12027_c0_g1_i1:64-921(+)